VRKGACPGDALTCPVVDILKAIQQGAEPVRYECRLERAIDGGAHWRNLANTTEPSVCGGDAALCQITLTTCLFGNVQVVTATADAIFNNVCTGQFVKITSQVEKKGVGQ